MSDELLPREAETASWTKLIDDLRVLMGDGEGLLKSLTGDMSEQAKAARAALNRQLESARVTLDQLQDRTLQQARKADKVIRTHPYHSVGVAFGLGIAVGVIATWKRDE
ncbi:MAG TPA: hypothetical protein VMZ27_06340 [Candidatus Saccharimonadales bacterium]|nr:hypothetical protein [Candidatus Saccharimonadales bacterium]